MLEERPSGAVALLVLLPTPTRAGVVAPDLVLLGDHALLDDRQRFERFAVLGVGPGPEGAGLGRGLGHRARAGGAVPAGVGDAPGAGGAAGGGEGRHGGGGAAVLAFDVHLHVEDHARVVGPH